MKEINSERTIKERCERSCGNIGKMIALRELFLCLYYNAKKKFLHKVLKITVIKSYVSDIYLVGKKSKAVSHQVNMLTFSIKTPFSIAPYMSITTMMRCINIEII